jgi:hypothetical protein
VVVVVSASEVAVEISVVMSDVLAASKVAVVLLISVLMAVSVLMVVSVSIVVSIPTVVPVPEVLTLDSEVGVSASDSVDVVASGMLDVGEPEDSASVGKAISVVASSDGVKVTPGMSAKEKSFDVSIGTVGKATVEVLEKRKELVCSGPVCVGSRDGGTRVVKSTSDVASDGGVETAGIAVLKGTDVTVESTVGCMDWKSVDVGASLSGACPSSHSSTFVND